MVSIRGAHLNIQHKHEIAVRAKTIAASEDRDNVINAVESDIHGPG